MSLKARSAATLDDLRRVAGKAELIAGRIVPLVPMGLRPGQVGGRIYSSLDEYATRTGRGVALPDNVGFVVPMLSSGRQSFSPDASYYIGPLPADEMDFIEGPPTLAVEVRSKGGYGDSAEAEMAAKRADYFEAGTPVVWDVDPRAKLVRAYRADAPDRPTIFGPGQVADAEPAVPGWRLAIDPIFAYPGNPPVDLERASTMATATQATPVRESAGSRLVLYDVGWQDYEAMLKIVGDRHIRVTFDAGAMEVCMPSQRHEQAAQLLGLFVPRLAEELEIPYEPLGMTTWKRPDAEKGLEADQCYYIQNQALVREKAALDLAVDPPPDLAIEVDITSSSLDRMGIYAGLGVPEVWRYDGRAVTMYGLGPDGRYQPVGSSRSFPGLRPADVERFLESGRTLDKIRWARELREWVRDELIPRAGRGEPPT